jgi:hypothetical protein
MPWDFLNLNQNWVLEDVSEFEEPSARKANRLTTFCKPIV